MILKGISVNQDPPTKDHLWITPKGNTRFWDQSTWRLISGSGGNGGDLPVIEAAGKYLATTGTPGNYSMVWVDGTGGNYLPLTGGTMTGNLVLKGGQYNREGALNCNNSDIINVNSILTNDLAENFGEGLCFYRSGSTWDCMTASNGTFYFGKDKTYQAAFAGDATIKCGQIDATHIISIANGTYGSRLHIANNTQNTYFEIWRDTVNKLFFGYCDANSHYQYITLLSNGNVGISNTTPGYKLTVEGNIVASNTIGISQTAGSGDGISLYGSPSSNPAYGLMFATTANYGTFGDLTGDYATYFTMDTTWGSKRGWAFRIKNTSTIVASLSTDGNFCAKGGVTALATSSSDKRLKKEIKPFNAKQIIDKLKPVEFEWNKKANKYNSNLELNKKNYGLIAQDSDNIIDNLVFDLPDGNGYKGVRYEKLIPILLQAVKEQQKEIDELKQIIKKLKV